jgi:hypothetical protein
MERYRSKGLYIDPAFVVIQSKDLPDGNYVPVSYETLIGTAGVGVFFAFLVFLVQARSRFEDKHRTSRSVIVLRGQTGNCSAGPNPLQQGNSDMIGALEFPYRPSLHTMAWASLFVLPAMLLLLAGLLGSSVSPGALLLVLVEPMVVLIPIVWFRSRGRVLRLTDFELRIGPRVLQVQNLHSIEVINHGLTRSMTVRSGKEIAAVYQWLLPSPRAFDQILQALSRLRRETPVASPNGR